MNCAECGHLAGAHASAFPGTCEAPSRVCLWCDVDAYRTVELIRVGRCPDCGRKLGKGVSAHLDCGPVTRRLALEEKVRG